MSAGDSSADPFPHALTIEVAAGWVVLVVRRGITGRVRIVLHRLVNRLKVAHHIGMWIVMTAEIIRVLAMVRLGGTQIVKGQAEASSQVLDGLMTRIN